MLFAKGTELSTCQYSSWCLTGCFLFLPLLIARLYYSSSRNSRLKIEIILADTEYPVPRQHFALFLVFALFIEQKIAYVEAISSPCFNFDWHRPTYPPLNLMFMTGIMQISSFMHNLALAFYVLSKKRSVCFEKAACYFEKCCQVFTRASVLQCIKCK